MIGPDLNNVTHDCTVVMPHLHRPLASDYADVDWMSGFYTFDGQEVFAINHAEYHGHEHPGYCGEQFAKCRYNAVTLSKLHEQRRPLRAPVPALPSGRAIPYRYVPGDGRYGFFCPATSSRRTAGTTTWSWSR